MALLLDLSLSCFVVVYMQHGEDFYRSCFLTAGRRGKDQKQQPSQDDIDAEQPPQIQGQWVSTKPTGERSGVKLDGTIFEVENALVSYASDPESGQVGVIFSNPSLLSTRV